MEKQSARVSMRMISVLAAMLLAVSIAFPVQAAPINGAAYTAVFDSTYYAGHNPDLQAAFGNNESALLNHFVVYGMGEGRQGNAEFNVQYYKASYPDLQVAFGENLTNYYKHYIAYGRAEGRIGNGALSSGTPTGKAVIENTLSVSPSGTGYEYEVLNIVNQVRAENGLEPLSTTPQLMNTALLRAKETEISFSHTRPNGSLCFTAFEQNGVKYGSAGENIAAGQRTPKEVMNGWLNSPGHRANILNGRFNHIGIGYYQGNSGYSTYWTQCFTD